MKICTNLKFIYIYIYIYIFNPCGEFRWSREVPVSQIHAPHLHAGAPGIFSDLFKFVQMLKREWIAESYRTYSSLVKLQPWFLSLRWKTCLCAECFLSLPWKTCLWAEHTHTHTHIYIYIYKLHLFILLLEAHYKYGRK